MQKVIALILFVIFPALLSAQIFKIFNKEKFNQLKVEQKLNELELDLLPVDSLPLALAPSNDISVYVPTGKMAEMPLMEINDNINYTLRIKKYSRTYPYSPATGDSAKDQIKPRESITIFKKLDRQE